jgi:hypothetical protein
MRHAVVLSAVLLALPTVGQDDPLPPVTPRVQSMPAVQPVLVALATEPIREFENIDIEEAARNNDYATFHALYEQTRNPAYAPLHELWTYSVNDPIGAFYGPEMYERFASLYPGLAAYIDEYKIVDDHGNVFYPTSETRTFLLARAVEGQPVESPEPIRVASARRSTTYSPSTTSPAPTSDPAIYSPTAPRVRMKKSEVTEPPAGLKPIVRPIAAPAPVPAPLIAKAGPAPQLPPVPAAPPIAAASAMAVSIPKPADPTSRGILLIVIGLVGIGLLALILRTPRETPPTLTPRQ